MSIRVAKATVYSTAVGASNVRYDTKARARDTVCYVLSLSLFLYWPTTPLTSRSSHDSKTVLRPRLMTMERFKGNLYFLSAAVRERALGEIFL